MLQPDGCLNRKQVRQMAERLALAERNVTTKDGDRKMLVETPCATVSNLAQVQMRAGQRRAGGL